MKKYLLSWVAFNQDFKNGNVNPDDSPNYQFHKKFYAHDKHFILSSSASDDLRLELLLNKLRNDFPDHSIEGVYMSIFDVIDLKEIKTKVENLLLNYKDDELDIFFSPGTSIMQLSWYICHSSLGLKTKLFQTRPVAKLKKGQSQIVYIDLEKSSVPYSAIIKQNLTDNKISNYEFDKNYNISESIKPVYEKALKIAQTDKVTCLILGESGTGKEHLAHYIHKNSTRCNFPFLAINCSAFTDSILESRLFGHRKGTFTGATEDYIGLFGQAESGTIFLDEIGDISPYMQQSLLRVLQEKEYHPIGGKVMKSNLRIIAATNKDLIKMCKEQKFRWDLYYRLAVAQLELPSLIARGKKDILSMIDFFIRKKKIELKKPQRLVISTEVEEILLNYTYPGNVRELENIIETLYVFVDTQVSVEDLPSRMQDFNDENSLSWKNAEKSHIRKVLSLCKGNQRRAWQLLEYGSLNTFKKKLKEYELV